MKFMSNFSRADMQGFAEFSRADLSHLKKSWLRVTNPARKWVEKCVHLSKFRVPRK